jgi:predicted dehydrogenase
VAKVDVIAYRVCGRDDEALSAQYGFVSYNDLDSALAQKPDAVLVTNPTSLHIPVALAAAEVGCHLFIEKPLSHTLDGVDELIAAVSRRHLVSLVGFNMRFHPGLQLIKRFLDENRIGRVVSVRAQVGQYLPDWHPWEDYRKTYSASRELGGGVILDLIHELDYLYWFFGPVRQVFCMAGHHSSLDIQTEDIAEILLVFESDIVASVHLDYVQRSASRTCHIIGEEGTIRWDYFANQVEVFDAALSRWLAFAQVGFERNQMFIDEIKHFLACLEGRQTSVIDVREGKRVLEIALAAKASAADARKLTLSH